MVTLYLNLKAVSNLIVIGRPLDGSNALLLDLEIPCRCHGLVGETFNTLKFLSNLGTFRGFRVCVMFEFGRYPVVLVLLATRIASVSRFRKSMEQVQRFQDIFALSGGLDKMTNHESDH